MLKTGQLFVFEGPDGVGKTALATEFTQWLRENGVPSELLAFPGSAEGTLGRHIYALHHDPAKFDVSAISPAGLQLLHIAAHLDAIENTILPLLGSGTSVVLDRFWWSTMAYGLVAGIDPPIVDAMIEVELRAWRNVCPAALFLIRRRAPLRPEPIQTWADLAAVYLRIATERMHEYPVFHVENEGTLANSLGVVQKLVKDSLGFSTEPKPPPSALPIAARLHSFSPTSFPPTTVVYDTLWNFAAERQAIFFRRLAASNPPWTQDRILAEYKFTNVYRATDRVSQFLIRHVIYHGDPSPKEVFFRVILFKLFNKIETWRLLENSFGAITYEDYEFVHYDRILTAAIECGQCIYSGAYIMPTARDKSAERKHRSHLQLLEVMMGKDLPSRICDATSMAEVYNLIRAYPMMGDFLAYQYATDLNYSSMTDFREMDFVVPGPGARSGIAKCFRRNGDIDEAYLIQRVTELQDAEFKCRDLPFQGLWGRPLQLIDVQNLFCEVDKYSRISHPEFNASGSAARSRIKQRFRPHLEPITYWFPPKWGLNDRIANIPDRSNIKTGIQRGQQHLIFA